jgi:hypothetical protein
MEKATALYTCHGWRVIESKEAGVWVVRDKDDKARDMHSTAELAIRSCGELAGAEYREHLTGLIREAEWDDVPTHVLETVAHLLGHKVGDD